MKTKYEEQLEARKELEGHVHAENLVGIDFLALLAGIAAFVYFVID